MSEQATVVDGNAEETVDAYDAHDFCAWCSGDMDSETYCHRCFRHAERGAHAVEGIRSAIHREVLRGYLSPELEARFTEIIDAWEASR